MTQNVSIDTNIILRLCIGDVPEQTVKAERLLKKHDVVVVSDVALTEAVFVLRRAYNFERDQIVETLEAFLSQQSISCDYPTIQKAFRSFLKYPALSFEDCFLTARARSDGNAPLYTLDKKLAAQLQHADLLA